MRLDLAEQRKTCVATDDVIRVIFKMEYHVGGDQRVKECGCFCERLDRAMDEGCIGQSYRINLSSSFRYSRRGGHAGSPRHEAPKASSCGGVEIVRFAERQRRFEFIGARFVGHRLDPLANDKLVGAISVTEPTRRWIVRSQIAI